MVIDYIIKNNEQFVESKLKKLKLLICQEFFKCSFCYDIQVPVISLVLL